MGIDERLNVLPRPVGIIATTSLLRAKSQTLVYPLIMPKKINNARQRGFKITHTIRVGHLGDDKLMTKLLGVDVNCHN